MSRDPLNTHPVEFYKEIPVGMALKMALDDMVEENQITHADAKRTLVS